MSELNELFNKYGSDKGSVHGDKHEYSFIYEKLFTEYRALPINMLELGLCKGGPELVEKHEGITRKPSSVPSVNAWLEYFPKSSIYGFDISDFSEYENERFKFIRGDMGNVKDLNQITELECSFDIILDDASHASYHQQLALVTLFKTLKPGGVYIIEDLAWQPQSHEIALPSCPKTLDLLTHFIKHGNFDLGNRVVFKEKLRTFLHKTKIRPDASLKNFSSHDLANDYLCDEAWEYLKQHIGYVSLCSRRPKSQTVAIWKTTNI